MRFTVSALLVALAASKRKRPGPAAHYVIRTSDLRATLDFTSAVLGLRVLRHEENKEACPITCNGDYAVPWSKTMVGTRAEDEAYALEITYNYGIEGYQRGTGLRHFEMYVADVGAALEAAKLQGYAVSGSATGGAVDGPDGYKFVLYQRPHGRREPFKEIRFAVPYPEATVAWYVDVLGMEAGGKPRSPDASVVASYASDSAESVVFRFDKGDVVTATQFDGRNALSLPSATVRAVYDRLAEEQPNRVTHELQEINEETGLGILLIAIVNDPNGLELCLVSSEAFEPAIAGAADYKGPDYDHRAQLAVEYVSKVAQAKASAPTTFGWAAEL